MNILELQQGHDSANEVYLTKKLELFESENIDESKWSYIANKRLSSLFEVLAKITPKEMDSMSSYIDVVDLFVSFFDDIVLECALVTDRRAETEKKILDQVKEALGTPTEKNIRDGNKEHIVSSLVDALVFHEADKNTRASTIESALINETNPLRLGLTFYKIFGDKYPDSICDEMLKYFIKEDEVRIALIKVSVAEASEKLTELFELDVNSSEKYLLMALNSFNAGLVNDAKRALEIGLNSYPLNKRLEDAKFSLLGLN